MTFLNERKNRVIVNADFAFGAKNGKMRHLDFVEGNALFY